MPSLSEHTATHREKLIERLQKQGIRSIAGLTYEQCLRSTLWKEIREWVITEQSGKCFICDHDANEVHHHDYTEETMWGMKPEGLVGLCSRCHDLVEFDESRMKRDDLLEKRLAFEHLLEIFEKLRNEGFLLSIKRVGLSTMAEHRGNQDFQKFIECSSLAYGFLVSFVFSDISFPTPLPTEKLSQKTGVRLSLRSTKQHVATVWADARSITMKRTKACTFPIEDQFQSFLREKPYVTIVA